MDGKPECEWQALHPLFETFILPTQRNKTSLHFVLADAVGSMEISEFYLYSMKHSTNGFKEALFAVNMHMGKIKQESFLCSSVLDVS